MTTAWIPMAGMPVAVLLLLVAKAAEAAGSQHDQPKSAVALKLRVAVFAVLIFLTKMMKKFFESYLKVIPKASVLEIAR